MKKYIGIDLGGTNLRAGVVDLEAGKVVFSKSIPTLAREGHDAVLSRMAALVEDVISSHGLTKDQVGGIGVGVPGRLDLEKGTSVFLTNFPGNWPNVPMRDILSRKTGLPVDLLNDASAITYGEWRFGAGMGVDDMVCYTIGTGVGGGLVIDGRLHMGIGGTAGELGHTSIDLNGPRCGCGNYGCLEAFASAPAIATMGLKAVVQGTTTEIGRLADYDLNKITPEVIARAARSGDAVAINIYHQVGLYFGVAIAALLVTVSPRKVVIGGGVAAASDLFFDAIRQTLKERVTVMPVEEVEVVRALLGNDAGILGVARWVSRNTE